MPKAETWPPILFQPHKNRRMMIRWGLTGKNLRIPLAYISYAALKIMIQITKGESIGIRLREGVDEDSGKFAMEIVTYLPRRGRIDLKYGNALKVTLRHQAAIFRPLPLMQIQNRGQSVLKREGNFLIGTLGDWNGVGDPPTEQEAEWLALGTWPHFTLNNLNRDTAYLEAMRTTYKPDRTHQP